MNPLNQVMKAVTMEQWILLNAIYTLSVKVEV